MTTTEAVTELKWIRRVTYEGVDYQVTHYKMPGANGKPVYAYDVLPFQDLDPDLRMAVMLASVQGGCCGDHEGADG